jgi:hypothetical protein
MTAAREKIAAVIFGIILVLVVTVSLLAYTMTGPQGIEDRFNNATGIVPVQEHENSGLMGFSIEGNPVSYAIILCALGIVCLLLLRYRKF